MGVGFKGPPDRRASVEAPDRQSLGGFAPHPGRNDDPELSGDSQAVYQLEQLRKPLGYSRVRRALLREVGELSGKRLVRSLETDTLGAHLGALNRTLGIAA